MALVLSQANAQAPGHRLVSPVSSTDTLLFDDQGVLVHTWPSQHKPGMAAYVRANGNLLRSIVTAEGPSGVGGGIQECTIDGQLVWDYRLDSDELLAHHDIEPLPNGNVLAVAWESLSRDAALAAGRDPKRLRELTRPDRIVEVRPTGRTSGEIVWSWRALDQAEIDINYPPERTSGELHHINGIDYDATYDWIVVAACFQDELWVIDKSSGQLVFRFGNPAAAGRATENERALFFPHAPRFVPQEEGPPHLLVFNNRAKPRSEVLEITLPTGKTTWSYSGEGFDSDYMASAERLPGGNTLVCSSMQLRVFEVDPAGDIVWEIGMEELASFPFHATYVERTLWADRPRRSISATESGRDVVSFHVIAGSRHAGEITLLYEGDAAPRWPWGWPWGDSLLGGGLLDTRGKARLAIRARCPTRLEWLGIRRSFSYRSLAAGKITPNAANRVELVVTP